jgi:amidohydrolase
MEDIQLREKIKQLAKQHFKDIVGIRRHLHQHPELSFEEAETSLYIREQLNSTGIPFKKGFVGTGIAGWINGRSEKGMTVALRADMDALPVHEKNDLPFKSQYEGRMHACGHDLHMSALLGASRILYSLRNEFDGKIWLIFQPAEEKLPGGANLMLKEGLFADGLPDVIIGQHVMPLLEAGKVGYRPGKYMASTDEIYLNVKGSGGHAAMPWQVIDPVLIAAHIIVALQQIVSRNANPAIPSVLSFGKVEALGATNIIPSEVKIAGTFRTMNEIWRKEAHEKIIQMAKSIATGMGGDCEVDIQHGYPVLFNHEEYTRRAVNYSQKLLGEKNVVDLEFRMTAEDFAYFAEKMPGVFYRFGITDAEGKFSFPLHSSGFMADEEALETAMANMAYLTLCFLKDGPVSSL